MKNEIIVDMYRFVEFHATFTISTTELATLWVYTTDITTNENGSYIIIQY